VGSVTGDHLALLLITEREHRVRVSIAAPAEHAHWAEHLDIVIDWALATRHFSSALPE
jgi:hypothetical protein